MRHKGIVGFLRLIGLVTGLQFSLIKIQTEEVQRTVLNGVGTDPRHLCPQRKQAGSGRICDLSLALFLRRFHRIPDVQNVADLSLWCQKHFKGNLLLRPAIGNFLSAGTFRQLVCIAAKRLYQHMIPSRYFFTSMMPSIICGR